jgi:hypothetical protein
MSFWDFIRITVRAILRIGTTIEPLEMPADFNPDLVVVESQTWLIGITAPVEALFEEPANASLFQGRDAATVNVCRGLARRPQAMLVRWLERLGARVVSSRTCRNPGWEPSRTFSLFFYLGFKREFTPKWLAPLLQPQHLDASMLDELEVWGQSLAGRDDGEAAKANLRSSQ